MIKILKYVVWFAAFIVLAFQENLYFRTIVELRIGSYNLFEISKILPWFILALILLGIYAGYLHFILKKKIITENFYAITLGVISLVSASIIFVALYINKAGATEKVAKKKVRIVEIDTMSGGKNGDDYPCVFVEVGESTKSPKRFPLRSYSEKYVLTKKYAVLTLRKGGLNWDIIENIELE